MAFFRSDLPTIIVGEGDRHDLLVLAMGGSGHSADAADDLLFELGRARIVPDCEIPHDVVRMGSQVVYRFDGGRPTSGTLAFPFEAAIELARVSVLSPLGTALLGLSPGQTMRWTTREGQQHMLEVETVSPQRQGASRM